MCLLQEADGNVVHLLLVEHSEGVRLPGTLGGAVSDEKGAVLQQGKRAKLTQRIGNKKVMETKSLGSIDSRMRAKREQGSHK